MEEDFQVFCFERAYTDTTTYPFISPQCTDCGRLQPDTTTVLSQLRIAWILCQLAVIIIIPARLRTAKPIQNLSHSIIDLSYCTSNVGNHPSTTDRIWSGHRERLKEKAAEVVTLKEGFSVIQATLMIG